MGLSLCAQPDFALGCPRLSCFRVSAAYPLDGWLDTGHGWNFVPCQVCPPMLWSPWLKTSWYRRNSSLMRFRQLGQFAALGGLMVQAFERVPVLGA